MCNLLCCNLQRSPESTSTNRLLLLYVKCHNYLWKDIFLLYSVSFSIHISIVARLSGWDISLKCLSIIQFLKYRAYYFFFSRSFYKIRHWCFSMESGIIKINMTKYICLYYIINIQPHSYQNIIRLSKSISLRQSLSNIRLAIRWILFIRCCKMSNLKVKLWNVHFVYLIVNWNETWQ